MHGGINIEYFFQHPIEKKIVSTYNAINSSKSHALLGCAKHYFLILMFDSNNIFLYIIFAFLLSKNFILCFCTF